MHHDKKVDHRQTSDFPVVQHLWLRTGIVFGNGSTISIAQNECKSIHKQSVGLRDSWSLKKSFPNLKLKIGCVTIFWRIAWRISHFWWVKWWKKWMPALGMIQWWSPGQVRKAIRTSACEILWIMIHWIGLRENLQETMVFTIKYRAFL